MDIQIEAASDRHGSIVDLYRWLRQDPDVRGHAVVELVSPQQSDGTMGAVDIINMVLSQGFTALNLALAYASWRTARPTAPPITIHVTGGSITVEDASEETVRRIVQALQPPVVEGNGPAEATGPANDEASEAE